MANKPNPDLTPQPFDEGTGYGDVITPGAQKAPRNVKIVRNAGDDSGGEGGTSGNYGGDATNDPDLERKNIP